MNGGPADAQTALKNVFSAHADLLAVAIAVNTVWADLFSDELRSKLGAAIADSLTSLEAAQGLAAGEAFKPSLN